MLTIAKFGGTSLADADRFRAVKKISESGRRQGIVVSAPGSRFPGDPKITDLLCLCYNLHRDGEVWQPTWDAVAGRFRSIAHALSLPRGCEEELSHIRRKLEAGTVERDYLISRGEYLCGLLLAEYLHRPFVDSASWLRFRGDGSVDMPVTCGRLWSSGQKDFVTSGFYGLGADGRILTFPRGGSDITGALAAVALEADLYENWTDVPGLLQADPKLVPEAKPVPALTYEELAELGALGVQVLHSLAIAPVQQAKIPLHIRCTAHPEVPGTVIAPSLPENTVRSRLLNVTGAGRRTLLTMTGPRSLTGLLREWGCAPDFVTAAPGRQTAAVPSEQLLAATEKLLPLAEELQVQDNMALLGVLYCRDGRFGPRATELLEALARAKIPVEAILRPYGGHSMLLAVPDRLLTEAIQSVCNCQ